jgi:hypothetical protein
MEIEGNTTGTLGFKDMTGASEADMVGVGLNAIMLSREGTLPGSRAFGLPQRPLHALQTEATLNMLGIELSNKAKDYFPNISIKQVSGETSTDGELKTFITVERR